MCRVYSGGWVCSCRGRVNRELGMDRVDFAVTEKLAGVSQPPGTWRTGHDALVRSHVFSTTAAAGNFQRLFGGSGKQAGPESDEDPQLVAAMRKVREVADGAGGLVLIYRTAGGLRVIVADRAIDPSSEEAGRLLDRMGSDPLYIRLCRNQRSFRARLTPKPWRCGHHAPLERWPFLDAKSERSFKAWEDEYLAKIREYSVSRLLGRVGNGKVHPAIEPVLAWHDQFSRADRGDLPLA